MRVIGYARRAPSEQGVPEFDLAHQEQVISHECDSRGWELVAMRTEIAADSLWSGTPRTVLFKAVMDVGNGKADVLMVSQADRISCGTGCFDFLDRYRQLGRAFVAIGDRWDTTTEQGAHTADVVWRLARVQFWQGLPRQTPRWDGRNAVVGSLVPAGSSVLDLGAGAKTLQEHIPADCRYQPCDIVDTAGVDVLICDFNLGIWPAVDRRYDVVVASGVIEYMTDPAEFVRRAVALGNVLLLTHVLRNPARPRPAIGWNTHLTEPEMDALLQSLAVEWQVVGQWRDHRVFEIRERSAGR